MANSIRNDMHPQLAPEDEVRAPKEDTTLGLGHAGLACDCWPGSWETGPRPGAMWRQRPDGRRCASDTRREQASDTFCGSLNRPNRDLPHPTINF
jgi:hypothetical protein